MDQAEVIIWHGSIEYSSHNIKGIICPSRCHAAAENSSVHNLKMKCHSKDHRNKLTCSDVAIEPWQVKRSTLLGSPKSGWALSWSLMQLISSQPVMKTKTAPGLSFRHIWHNTASIRLNPMQSGVQHDKESRTRGSYFSKLDLLRASWK